MEEIVRGFRDAGVRLGEPASLEAIEETEKALDGRFPELLVALYRDHDGMRPPPRNLAPRLMPLNEVTETHTFVKEYVWADWGVRLFWTDDSSNYVGLYVTGPLTGKVCFLDHEESDFSPAYKGLPSFLTALLDGIAQDEDWHNFPRDYPALAPSSDPRSAAEDWQLAQSLQPLFEAASDDEERLHHAYCIMALTPYEQTETLLALTYNEDMYIQERACEILGKRHYEPARSRLKEVARSGTPNGRSAAEYALKQLSR